MLIINGVTRKPRAEQQVVEWLSNYITHPGVAVSGVHVPDSRGRTTAADFVVFTPYAAAVIGVEGLRKKVGGMLMCSMNERWSIVGTNVDPVHVHPGDLNPLHRVREAASGLRKLATSKLDREPFVDGLVLVIPFPHRTVRLDRGPLPPGFNVLLGDSAAQLYSWFNRAAQQRSGPVWNADAVLEMLTALRVDGTGGTTNDRLFEQLVAEGFPADLPDLSADDRAPAPAAVSVDADTSPAPATVLADADVSDTPAAGELRGTENSGVLMPGRPSASGRMSVPTTTPASSSPDRPVSTQPIRPHRAASLASQLSAGHSTTGTTERPRLPIRTPGSTWETNWPSHPARRAEYQPPTAADIPAALRPDPPTGPVRNLSTVHSPDFGQTAPADTDTGASTTPGADTARPPDDTAAGGPATALSADSLSAARTTEPLVAPHPTGPVFPPRPTEPGSSTPGPEPAQQDRVDHAAPQPGTDIRHGVPAAAPGTAHPDPTSRNAQASPDGSGTNQWSQDAARPPRHRLRTALLTAAAVIFLACGIWVVTGNDNARAQPDGHSPPTTAAVHPAAEYFPPPLSETAPPAPAPRLFPDEKTCYPFQPEC